ncbi:MAG: tetratricopeptide repeat protein [Dokdonella sp.]
MQALADFHFLRPLALLLLLVVPLFWLLWRNARTDAGAWRAAVDAHLLPHLLERIDGGSGRSGLWLAALLWALASVALAGPAWEREPMPLYRNQAARVLALELAPTMLAQDEKPNRLARARYKLEDILTRSRDYQTALIGYAGDAFVAAPLTDDVDTVRNLVDALDPATMPVSGNNTARAIGAGVDLIEQAGLRRGEIILLADSVGSGAAAAARRAHDKGITVSVLGIGNATGAPVPLAQGDFLKDESGNVVVTRLDEAALRAVAGAGGGRFAALTADTRDLDGVLADRVDTSSRADEAGGNPANAQTAESARWRDRGPWLLLLLAPLALFGFRRGWLMVFALALVSPAPSASAASLADLWQRPDQQAAAALSKGDAKQAASVARSPEWRGGAAYRDGDYESAAADYAKAADADGAYNKGNALAKLGRYDDAIAAYDQALKLAPDMADATANKRAVEEFQKQKQDKNSPSQKDGKDSQKRDSKDKNSQQQSDQDSQKQDSKDKDSQQNESSDQKDQQQDQQGQPQDQQSSSQSGDQQDAQKKQDEAQQNADSQQQSASGGRDEKQDKAQQSAQKLDAAQQKALSKEIDKALAGQPQPADKNAKAQAGVAEEDDATREKKQALEHWLQRVPDDPGGLLRRKFQLEYQRRQQHAGDEP